ncbi:MAG TPA: cold-shock protein, partial [Porticoccaceae bacterium]|nr:cold-shock protein [Porticoccaceae bacterium]
FNNAKGYGFIMSEESGSDIFAHYTAIEMDGYKTLKAGQVVSFDLVEGAKGVHAEHIKADTVGEHCESRLNGARAESVLAAENFNRNR